MKTKKKITPRKNSNQVQRPHNQIDSATISCPIWSERWNSVSTMPFLLIDNKFSTSSRDYFKNCILNFSFELLTRFLFVSSSLRTKWVCLLLGNTSPPWMHFPQPWKNTNTSSWAKEVWTQHKLGLSTPSTPFDFNTWNCTMTKVKLMTNSALMVKIFEANFFAECWPQEKPDCQIH